MLKCINGKVVKIPEATIQKNMKVLGITEEEAVQMYLDDEGITVNETVEALTDKVKKLPKERLTANKKAEKKPSVEKRERKPNEAKRKLIDFLFKGLVLAMPSPSIVIVNPEREITFKYEGVSYSVTLTAHRSKKD